MYCITKKISLFSKYFQLLVEAIILKTKSADIDHLVELKLSWNSVSIG